MPCNAGKQCENKTNEKNRQPTQKFPCCIDIQQQELGIRNEIKAEKGLIVASQVLNINMLNAEF